MILYGIHEQHARIQEVLPEGVKLFLSLVDEGRVQIPIQVDHYLPVSETPFPWRANDGPTLNAGLNW